MKRTIKALLAVQLALMLALSIAPLARAQSVGGFTTEVCTGASFAVTASSAYSAGNEVGPLIAFTPFRPVAQGVASDYGGVIQSIRLAFKDTQTAGFKAYQFAANPSHTTFTDKSAPSINSADALLPHPPIALSNNDSGLGTHTVYGADAIGRAHVAAGATDYWLLVTTGTPTFGTTADAQFCVTYLND